MPVRKKHRSNPSNYSILFQILLKICSIEVLGDKTRNQPTSNDIRWQEAHVELIFLTIVTQPSISVPCIERTTSVGASHLIGHIISLYIIWYTLIHTVSYHIYVVTYNMVKQVTSLSSTNQELMRQVENPCSAKMQKGKWPMTGGSQDVTIMKKNLYQHVSTSINNPCRKQWKQHRIGLLPWSILKSQLVPSGVSSVGWNISQFVWRSQQKILHF